jgi:hypothetical protein
MHDVYKPHHPPYVCLLIIIVPYMLHLLYNPNPPPLHLPFSHLLPFWVFNFVFNALSIL